MIPMSPGLRVVQERQVVVVDISQLSPEKPSQTTSGFRERKVMDYVESENHPIHWIKCPIIKFIQDAYVWIPKDRQGKRPATRPPASCIIPRDRRIGIIYFLLIICGCRVEIDGVVFMSNEKQFQQATKCVIFVDTEEDPDTKEALRWLMNALESWRDELSKENRKELIVFDSNLLTYQSMSLLTSLDDVEGAAIWRSRV